jgi:hypothetical protein
VSAVWVAGSVRAASLSRRRLGAAGARALAGEPDLRSALTTLAATPYGHDVKVEQSLSEAQRAVGATLLWHMRVLAGWLPRSGSDVVRLMAAGFEIANVQEHLHRLRGGVAEPPFNLGTLETAWSRLTETTTYGELREVLAASAWGDPGSDHPPAIDLGIRLAWADRLLGGVPETATWARAASLLLLLRHVLLDGRRPGEELIEGAVSVLDRDVVAAVVRGTSPPTLASALPAGLRWVLEDIADPTDLWRAEAAWWHRVERDGFALLRRADFGRATVVGALAVLAADAWRVRAALESAATGDRVLEVFSAVA